MRNWKAWFKAAGIRAIRTVAQTAIATIGVAAVISEVDWIAVASASVLAGILSLLTSLAGLPEIPAEAEDDEGVSRRNSGEDGFRPEVPEDGSSGTGAEG